MKKNKINILLIVVVAAIWGFVLLKATGNLFARDEEVATSEDTALPPPITLQKKINHELQLNYRDPFLGGSDKPSVPISANINPVKIKNEKIQKEKPVAREFPKVKFYGLVRNTDTNKMIAIMSINNRETRMLPGEIFEEVKLEKITRDSILVSWNKNKLYIKK